MARPPLVSEHDVRWLKEISFHGLVDKHAVCERLNISEKTAERVLKKIGLKHTSQYRIDISRRYLEGEHVLNLAAEYGVSQVTINAFFRRHGIPTRGATYLLDKRYFRVIDSEEKAYFLGFIYADGCVHKNSMLMTLAEVDRGILQKFKELVGSNKPLYETVSLGFGGLKSKAVRLELVSKDMVDDLSNLGVRPNKTHTATFPDCMKNTALTRHFLRGVWDGDGCLSLYEIPGKKEGTFYTKYSMSLCGTREFLEGVRSILGEVAEVQGHMSRRFNTEGCCWTLTYSGGASVKKLSQFLYSDSSIYLPRKHEKYAKMHMCV